MSGPVVHCDFETYSEVDLRAAGAYAYAEHASTEILCMAWAIGDQAPQLWLPGDPFPPALAERIAAGGHVVAWNAPFERQIWAKVAVPRLGWPPLPDDQLYCAAAMAANMGLPRDLATAARALGLPAQKDAAGHRIMLKLSKPRRPSKNNPATRWTPESAPEDFRALYAYCLQDVETERGVHRKLYALSDREREIFLLDQRINDRGVKIDRPLIAAAQRVVDDTLKTLDGNLARVTAGAAAAATQTARLADWVNGRGVMCSGVSAAEIRRMLLLDLPTDVRAALECRQLAGKSSTAKLEAMLAAAGSGDRIRGSLLYYGAARTGRWSGRLHQPQNYPRGDEGVLAVLDAAVDAIATGMAGFVEAMVGNPMEAVSTCLRPMMVAADGHDLIAVDFANIEGRVLAWLAGETWKLDAFRAYDAGTGPDLYKVAYSRSLGVPVDTVTKPQRQVGKVIELACGYQGWVGAFQTFAALYGISVADDEAARLAGAWREAHPKVVATWRGLNQAAVRAVLQPGTAHSFGRIAYVASGGWLWCRLPSGRVLAYCNPSIQPNSRGESAVWFWGVDSVTKQWVEISGYGGLWTENIVQAISRDLLAEAMLRCEAAGYPLVLTVHDELVAEVPHGFGSVAEMESLAAELPAWAEGLPVAAAGWRGRRYQK